MGCGAALWRGWQSGQQAGPELLLDYNAEDVRNLKPLGAGAPRDVRTDWRLNRHEDRRTGWPHPEPRRSFVGPASKPWATVKVYDRTAPEDVEKRAGDAEVVFTNKTPLNRETIRHLTKLKYIGVLATGYNVVNVEAAKKRGVVVTNVPGYGTASVAQHTFALLLELTSRWASRLHGAQGALEPHAGLLLLAASR
jgi:hypothetical protein